jgi:hypothetical protein
MSTARARGSWVVAALAVVALTACSSSGDSASDTKPGTPADTVVTTGPLDTVEPATTVAGSATGATDGTTQPVATPGLNPAPFSFASALAGTLQLDQALQDYPSYTKVADASGKLSAEVPAVWDSISAAPLKTAGNTVITQITASTNRDELGQFPGTAGIFIASVPDMTQDEAAKNMGVGGNNCTDGGFVNFDDGTNTGVYRVQTNCDGSTNTSVSVAFSPKDGSRPVASLYVKMFTQADLAALDHAYATYRFAK